MHLVKDEFNSINYTGNRKVLATIAFAQICQCIMRIIYQIQSLVEQNDRRGRVWSGRHVYMGQ